MILFRTRSIFINTGKIIARAKGRVIDINSLIVYLINAIVSIVKDYPLTIILVTLLFKLILMPFDIFQKKNARKTAALQYEVASIKKRYKDPQVANKKVQELYREKGVSTFAGCLPLALTFVLLISFFGALRTIVAEQTSALVLKISAYGAENVELPKWLWINNFWQPDSGFSTPIATVEEFLKFLRQNIASVSPESLMMLKNSGILQKSDGALIIAENTYNALRTSVLDYNNLNGLANGWFGLPIITGLTTFLQTKLSMKGQPTQDSNDQLAATNSTMLYFMPIFSAYMCLSSNSGFAVYWAVSNIYSIIFTLIINAVYNIKDKKAAV
jgi:YidC/Oxa1 family membrane protein insertase